MPQVSDDVVARYTCQTGMATAEQIEQARLTQSQAAQAGKPISLSEALVQQGVITVAQRESVDKRVKAHETRGIKQLGSYKLIKKLGEGGMGAVYLAEDIRMQRKVAVKVLPEKYAEDSSFLSRFRREARSMGKLNHMNVIAAFDVGEDMGHHYYVMEYCEGEPLDKILDREKTLDVMKAVDIIAQSAKGLEHAHQHGVIHRDIKPGNIFITTDGTVKILDLGLSKNISDVEQSFNTQSGVVLGTPHYISPEQALGEKNIDGRTDIYSLGATFYHLLTGEAPFHGPSIAVILSKHLTEQLPNPQDLRADIPDDVIQVIQRMMGKKPEHRHANCGDLIKDLECVKSGAAPVCGAIDSSLSSVNMKAAKGRLQKTLVATALHKSPSKAQETMDLYAPSKQAQRGTLVWAGVGAAAVLLIAVAAFAVGANTRNEPKTMLVAGNDEKKQQAPVNDAPAKTADTPKNADNGKAVPPSDADFKRMIDTKQDIVEKAPNAAPGRGPVGEKIRERMNEAAERRMGGQAEAAKAAPTAPKGPTVEEIAAQKALRSREISDEIRQEVDPLLKQSRLNDALKLLEAKAKKPNMADAKDLIAKEQADIEAIKALRSDAIEAMRKLPEVTMKIGTSEMTVKVTPSVPGMIAFRSKDGADLARSADNLDIEDVARYAPKEGGKTAFRRGLMFLAAEDFKRARKNFLEAQEAGEAVKPYLERIDKKEGVGQEALAQEQLKKFDAAVASKSGPLAKIAYDSLMKDFASTEAVKSRGAELKERLEDLSRPEGAAPGLRGRDEEFIKYIANLPLEDQAEKVTKRLRELNPDFEGAVKTLRYDDMPTANVITGDITNIAPVRALKVQCLMLPGMHQKRSLADISALRGMDLKMLDLSMTKVTDLSPLQGMPLRQLVIHGDEALTDLKPIRQLEQLKWLKISSTGVTDLRPLRGTQLEKLDIENTEVSDVGMLDTVPLEELVCTPRNITRGWEILKNSRTLKFITSNGRRVTKDEFFAKMFGNSAASTGGGGEGGGGGDGPAMGGNDGPPDRNGPDKGGPDQGGGGVGGRRPGGGGPRPRK